MKTIVVCTNFRPFTTQPSCAQRGSEGAGEEALLRLESDAERVQIVTIHTSKGLEYPLVFCPFLWDGKTLYYSTISNLLHEIAHFQIAPRWQAGSLWEVLWGHVGVQLGSFQVISGISVASK